VAVSNARPATTRGQDRARERDVSSEEELSGSETAEQVLTRIRRTGTGTTLVTGI
jgi:hypothetical protein